MSQTLKCKGFIGIKGDQVYYHDSRNVYRASVGAIEDCVTGYLMGRWECSVKHWNRFCESVYGLQPVEAK